MLVVVFFSSDKKVTIGSIRYNVMVFCKFSAIVGQFILKLLLFVFGFYVVFKKQTPKKRSPILIENPI